MNFIALLVGSFCTGFGIGFSKFFGLGYLLFESGISGGKTWMIQLVAAIMTIGPALIYFVSGPLASSRKKSHIMGGSAMAISLMLLLGQLIGWIGSAWIYLLGISLLMGIFAAAKMASVPLESERSGRSTEAINGGLTGALILGLLSSAPVGQFLWEQHPGLGIWVASGVFAIAGIAGLTVHFPNEILDSFAHSKSRLLNHTVKIAFRYPVHLISSPLLWGTGSAMSLALIAFAEEQRLGSPVACTLMPLYAALGIIAGSVLCHKFKAIRYQTAFFGSTTLMVLIPLTPVVVKLMHPSSNVGENFNIYIVTAGITSLLGFAFGLVTTTIDSDYLTSIGRDKIEGTGAAFQSAVISFAGCIIGCGIGVAILQNWMDSTSQFIAMGSICAFTSVILFGMAVANGVFLPFLARIVCRCGRLLLSCRYRITMEGLDKIDWRKGVIFLPNHPCGMDPVILGSSLWTDYRARFMVVEDTYHLPPIKPVMKLIRAFPVPNVEVGGGQSKLKRVKQVFEDARECLKDDNVVVYPAGRLMSSGLESLGGASGVFDLVSKVENPRVVMVRTRGLWGSSFSRGLHSGKSPDIIQVIKGNVSHLFKNLFLLMPKRDVHICFEKAPEALFQQTDKLSFNKFLETWYNKLGEEPLVQRPYQFWSADLPKIAANKENNQIDVASIDETIRSQVTTGLSVICKMDVTKIHPGMRLSEDLGMDSLDRSTVMLFLEETFFVDDVEFDDLNSVADVMQCAAGNRGKSKQTVLVKPVENWIESNRPEPAKPTAPTLPLAYLQCSDRCRGTMAVGDESTGPLPWKRFMTGCILMADVFRKWPENRVGVMLPASTGAAMTIMAMLLAKKIPVMINWTLGPANLQHVLNISGIKDIVTSSKFIDRLDGVELGPVENTFIFLEEISQKHFGLGEKLAASLEARNNSTYFMERFELSEGKCDDEAIILFTSGSESAPKGVPISHENILNNIRGAWDMLGLNRDDIVYSFLPAFHSFGLTATLLLPLTTGLKVVFHPNPTEYRRLARGCAAWGITLLCGTPTFISGILNSATEGQLKSLRVLIAGAEKVPETLYKAAAELQTAPALIEGYGVTENSPVISMNRVDRKRAGVGWPLENIHLNIVDPESHTPVEAGQRGLILVRGNSTFKGYLGDVKNPFVQLGDISWYSTGDLGYLNPDGALILSGRMKRFIKVAGEMISLPAVEEAVAAHWPADDDGPKVAIEAVEKEGERPVITLFSVDELDLDNVNSIIKSAGFSSLAKVGVIKRIETIPLLGTGKTDYRSLKAILTERRS